MKLNKFLVVWEPGKSIEQSKKQTSKGYVWEESHQEENPYMFYLTVGPDFGAALIWDLHHDSSSFPAVKSWSAASAR